MISIRERTYQSSSSSRRIMNHPKGHFFYHQPVLINEVIDALKPSAQGRYVDCTVGEGGHAQALLQSCLPGGYLLGIDPDPSAIAQTRRRLQSYSGSFTLVQGSYTELSSIANDHKFWQVDGILFDLGLSSLQLQRGLGFSFQRDEYLDMRFDPAGSVTAADIINTYALDELRTLIKEYGEEPRARSIAKLIVEKRPISSTAELSTLITKAVGARRGRIHPATRTFQALRIAVNEELDNLKLGLSSAINLLGPGGRLVVISYHSLEDRIVKTLFSRESTQCICPPGLPVCACNHQASLKKISRKVVTPSLAEKNRNPRSRSAKMRIVERLSDSISISTNAKGEV